MSNAEKLKALKLTMDKIDKDFGKGSVMIMGDKPHVEQEVISTGSLGLDVALGIGGLPKGRVIEIYGPESSGKTTVATHVIAESQKKGGMCAFIDAEHCMSADTLIYEASVGKNLSCKELYEKGGEFNVASLVDKKMVSQKAVIKYIGEKEMQRLERLLLPAPGDSSFKGVKDRLFTTPGGKATPIKQEAVDIASVEAGKAKKPKTDKRRGFAQKVKAVQENLGAYLKPEEMTTIKMGRVPKKPKSLNDIFIE